MRHLLFGAVVAAGFVTATLSCGTAARCSPATCSSGCCDTAGLCQSGFSSSACGDKGALCAVCGLTASCQNGVCMNTVTGGTGGGVSGSGGGTSSTGGGSSSTGGGSSSTGGGSSSTGGGSSSTGGGSSSTGGGSSSTGGGSSSTGGGSANPNAFCGRMELALNRFFAGRPACSSGSINITPSFSASTCLSVYPVCTSADRMTLDTLLTCVERAPACTVGNEGTASSAFLSCVAPAQTLSQACQNAL